MEIEFINTHDAMIAVFPRIGYGHRAAIASYKAFPDLTLATDETRRVGVSCPFRSPLIALKCHRALYEDVWAT